MNSNFKQEPVTFTNDIKTTMLGVDATAEAWGISKYYARQLALSGKVKAVRVGRGKILINQQSVAEFFNSSYLNEPSTPAQTSGMQPISVRL